MALEQTGSRAVGTDTGVNLFGRRNRHAAAQCLLGSVCAPKVGRHIDLRPHVALLVEIDLDLVRVAILDDLLFEVVRFVGIDRCDDEALIGDDLHVVRLVFDCVKLNQSNAAAKKAHGDGQRRGRFQSLNGDKPADCWAPARKMSWRRTSLINTSSLVAARCSRIAPATFTVGVVRPRFAACADGLHLGSQRHLIRQPKSVRRFFKCARAIMLHYAVGEPDFLALPFLAVRATRRTTLARQTA